MEEQAVELTHSIEPFLFERFSKEPTIFFTAVLLVLSFSLFPYSMRRHSALTAELFQIPEGGLGFLSVVMFFKVRVEGVIFCLSPSGCPLQ